MKLVLMSSGKSAVLSGQVNADLYIDCRGIFNPFRVFPHKTGDDPEVLEWMKSNNQDYIEAAIKMVKTALETAPSRNSFRAGSSSQEKRIGLQDASKPLTVCFFCLAGVHRSRAMKNILGSLQWDQASSVEVIK